MIVRLNTALRNLILNAILLSGGAIEYYDGVMPAGGDNIPTGNLLSTIVLPVGATNPASAGTMTKSAADWADVSVDLGGVVTYIKIKNSDGTLWMYMDVTDLLGVGAVKMSSTTVLLGELLLVTNFALTMPESTP